MCLVLLGLSVLFPIVIAILNFMSNYQDPIISQFDVFELQFKQLLIRSLDEIKCTDGNLILGDNVIVWDRHRIVKKPGYEILLENVEAIFFDCDLNRLFIEMSDGDKKIVSW